MEVEKAQMGVVRRRSLPKVILVGGPDVDARLELMHSLEDDFNVSALGSLPTLQDRFLAEGFDYSAYHLRRRVNPLSDLWTVGQLVLILQKLRPQIVHAFDTKPGVWACIAARLAGVPIVIATVTGLEGSLSDSDSLKTQLIKSVYQRLRTLACHVSDLTIFQNHDDVRKCIASGIVSRQKTKVILGSGVSTDLFARTRVSDGERARLRHELGIQPDQVVVTMISRVMRSKGVVEFMTAARAVRLAYPHVCFLLVGPEEVESSDRLNSAELTELKRTVHWPGPRRDIPAVLAVSDIFVLPTAYGEGLPRVLLEAASMELPIVTSDSPGCNEVVEDGVNGFLTPEKDAEAVKQAILRLIEQPGLRHRFGRVSRERVVERFEISIIASQTRSVYRQLLACKAHLPAAESL